MADDPREVFDRYIAELDTGAGVDIDALCRRHPDLAEPLRREYEIYVRRVGADDSSGSLWRARPPADVGGEAPPRPGPTLRSADRIIEQLSRNPTPADRYAVKAVVASGGMGRILRVRDDVLCRDIAMKLIGGRDSSGRDERVTSIDTTLLDRFLEEAQVTGQLQHPGVVPVHDLGIDQDGRVYFTMRLVKGQNLGEIIDLALCGAEGWDKVRVLGVILKVCETMAYVHSRGVIHRDLKPSNIMVGRFGETYVMDWGIARVLDRRDTRDIRIRPEPATETKIESRRSDEREVDPDAPLVTMDGDVIGTPAYMPPEQARGDIDAMGAHSDVYAVGAILYELLAGRKPFTVPGARVSARTLLHRVLDGPPRRIEEIDPSVPGELVAICERAMQRDGLERYLSMNRMAKDLRAFLEHRVVEAYETGAFAEFKKWVRRNRATAAALAAVIVVVTAAGFVTAQVQHDRAMETQRHLDEQRGAVLVRSADELWPVNPRMVPQMQRWLDAAAPIAARRAEYERELDELTRRGTPLGPLVPTRAQELRERRHEQILGTIRAMKGGAAAIARNATEGTADPETGRARIAILELEVDRYVSIAARLEAQIQRDARARAQYRFDRPDDAQLYQRLVEHVNNLDELAREPFDLIGRIRTRRDRSASLEQTLDDPGWQEAMESIADPARCPAYAGLHIQRQLGLVPLRRNDRTGLWEFWHVLSGDRPETAPDGRYVVRPETGIVLVLVPGGTFLMGAQSSDPDAPGYDPDCRNSETPIHPVELDPYFISKYEMTQEQWFRATGTLPSENFPGTSPRGSPMTTPVHPVEQVSWEDCDAVLEHWGLLIPTEAQWERAARGGRPGPYWSDFDTIRASVNALDAHALELSTTERRDLAETLRSPAEAGALDARQLSTDGYSHHAPVNAFEPNPFGLYNVLGNVAEWTRDAYCLNYTAKQVRGVIAGTGELLSSQYVNFKSYRGGGFEHLMRSLRVTQRFKTAPLSREEGIGVRPGRPLFGGTQYARETGGNRAPG